MELYLDMLEEENNWVRGIAREEIASLCGLILRRLQDVDGIVYVDDLNGIFGEALKDFSDTSIEPGE